MQHCTDFPASTSGIGNLEAPIFISVGYASRSPFLNTSQMASVSQMQPPVCLPPSTSTLSRQHLQLPSSNSPQFCSQCRLHAAPTRHRRKASKVFSCLQVPEEHDAAENEKVSEDKETIEMKGNADALLKKATQALGFTPNKPEICTAEELHYVEVPGTDWQLALWRYPPRPQATARNHPLLLLSGLGTNAIGFDLDPSVSLARFMSEQGFDTWILEVRGSGLSKKEGESPVNQSTRSGGAVSGMITKVIKSSPKAAVEVDAIVSPENADVPSWPSLNVAATLSISLLQLSEVLRSILNEVQPKVLTTQLSGWHDELKEKLTGILEESQDSVMSTQIADLTKRLVKLLDDSVSQFSDFQDRLVSSIDDFQKVLDMIVKYDWDFDNILEEDIVAAMDYIRSQTKPKDGKLHALGHSMGGIVLYGLLATKGEQCGLATVVTLASSLDYGVSDSSLKLLLPLADPVQALNVPVVPLGALMMAIHPLASNPPYVLAWLSRQVSAKDMMDTKLLEKLVLNSFCTIPAKLLLQLSTVFQPGGLQNRSGTLLFKQNLSHCNVPVLAIAGDEDSICPPIAVLDTVKALPQDLATYKLFGGQGELHYGHYDLVCGRMTRLEVHPCIQGFLVHHDDLQVQMK